MEKKVYEASMEASMIVNIKEKTEVLEVGDVKIKSVSLVVAPPHPLWTFKLIEPKEEGSYGTTRASGDGPPGAP